MGGDRPRGDRPQATGLGKRLAAPRLVPLGRQPARDEKFKRSSQPNVIKRDGLRV
jgi:hypothetical protein